MAHGPGRVESRHVADYTRGARVGHATGAGLYLSAGDVGDAVALRNLEQASSSAIFRGLWPTHPAGTESFIHTAPWTPARTITSSM